MHYYKKNIGDYAKKTGRLSMLQHGAYTLLLDACYDREKFPTLAEAIEWTWASSRDEIEAVEFVLRRFFTLVDGVFFQARIAEEIESYKLKSEKNKLIAGNRETKRAEISTKRARNVHETSPENENTEQNVHVWSPNHKPLTNNHKPLTKKDLNQSTVSHSSTSGQIAQVFAYWQLKCNHESAKLDQKRVRAIKARFCDGYTVAQLCTAIDGCRIDPFSQGDNDRKTIYDDIELICRTASKVDHFVAIAQHGVSDRPLAQQKTFAALDAYMEMHGHG